MLLDYSRAPKEQDGVIYQAAEGGRPIRIRLQPTVLIGGGSTRYRQHRQWTSVRWLIDVATPEEAFALRDALQLFFQTVRRDGAAVVCARLTGGEAHAPVREDPGDDDHAEAPGENHTARAAHRG